MPKDEEELHSVRIAACLFVPESLTVILRNPARGRSCSNREVERDRVLHQLHGKPTAFNSSPDFGGLPPAHHFLPFRHSSPLEQNIAACAIVVSPDLISQCRRYFLSNSIIDPLVIAIVRGYGTAVCLTLALSSLEDAHPLLSSVGSGNHRQFLLFVATLVAGISLFDALTVSCECSSEVESSGAVTLVSVDYTENASTFEPTPSAYLEFCNIAPSLCGAYHYAPFLFVVASWSTLQLTWTIILLATQIFQVCRQMTTLEVSNLGRYGFMGGRGGSSLREQNGAMAQLMVRQGQQPSLLGAGPGQSGAEEEGEILSSTQSGDSIGGGAIPIGGTNGAHVHGPGCKHHGQGHAGHHHRFGIVGRICSTALHACTGGPMLQLLGLDRFTKGKAMSGMRKSGQGGAGSNPFSLGVVGVSIPLLVPSAGRG